MHCKTGKERKLLKDNFFRAKYGTVDSSKLKSIYINLQSWVKPREEINFETKIRLIRRDLVLKVKSILDKELFSDNIILDLDLRHSGMRLNKKSFMSIDITLFLKYKDKFNSEKMRNRVYSIIENVISEMNKNNFEFYSKK